MLPFEFVLFVIVAVLLAMGFVFRQYVFGVLGSMLLVLLGVYISRQGLLGQNNFLSEALSLVFIAIGAYVLIRGSLELLRGETASGEGDGGGD